MPTLMSNTTAARIHGIAQRFTKSAVASVACILQEKASRMLNRYLILKKKHTEHLYMFT